MTDLGEGNVGFDVSDYESQYQSASFAMSQFFRASVNPSANGKKHSDTRLSVKSFAFSARIATVSASVTLASATLPSQRVLSMAMSPPRRTSSRHFS